mgnify:CR=1 FL=1|jgi:hypothetical protein
MGCLNVHTRRIGEGLQVSSERVGGGLKVSCGLVCLVNAARILKVEPKYIFLMEANNYTEEVCIISNVEWHIS